MTEWHDIDMDLSGLRQSLAIVDIIGLVAVLAASTALVALVAWIWG